MKTKERKKLTDAGGRVVDNQWKRIQHAMAIWRKTHPDGRDPVVVLSIDHVKEFAGFRIGERTQVAKEFTAGGQPEAADALLGVPSEPGTLVAVFQILSANESMMDIGLWPLIPV